MNIVSNDVWRLKKYATACDKCSKEEGPVVTNWSWGTLEKNAVVCLDHFSLDEQEAIKKRGSAEDNVAEGYDKQQQEYTCYDCPENGWSIDPERPKCEWAFDDYNKEGDCLADK